MPTPSRTVAGLSRKFALAVLLPLASIASAALTSDIRIDAAQPTVALSPHLYGLFFEDINYGADGGLYAELVENRSFEYNNRSKPIHHALYAWDKVERDGAVVSLTASDARPLNANNRHYLSLNIEKAGVAGAGNLGFGGIRIDSGARYDVSLHARVADWTGAGSLTVSLELPDGTKAGSLTLDGIGSDWGKHEGVLIASETSDQARLVVTTRGQGVLDLDMVSLFPQDTWRSRKQGLRKDLIQSLHDMSPKFLRFPGGCIAHGAGLENQYNWKDTVGDIAERKPNWNLWGYHQTYGLGYYEYFLLCEDLGAAALPVISVGVSCGFQGPGVECVPMNQLDAYIQHALDLVEFANGPVDSKWGALRAKMGHPAPFNLEYVCLGNEEHDTPEMRERFPYFVKAFREKYPDLKLIGNSGLSANIPLYDLMTKERVYSSDEHYYELPEWFLVNQRRFDSFDRTKPKIFLGEYASWNNNVFSAVAEAAYLTGVERNGDIVDMTAYAPLFGRQGYTQWNPNLIYFDQRRVLLTPNYHVQRLFSQNKGDVYLANTVHTEGAYLPLKIEGRLGIGSAGSAVEIASVTVNDQAANLSLWSENSGKFTDANGERAQTDASLNFGVLLSPEPVTGGTLTYKIRARKTAGDEGGIVVVFGADAEGKGGYVWTIGADKNTRHSLQQVQGYSHWSKLQLAVAPGSLDTGTWHDLVVELSPDRIRCDLDGQTVLNHVFKPYPVSVSSTLDRSADEIIVKLVNPHDQPVDARITIVGAPGLASQGRITSLGGPRTAKNTFEQPDAVKPVTGEIAVAPEFTHRIPANTVQFIRIPRGSSAAAH